MSVKRNVPASSRWNQDHNTRGTIHALNRLVPGSTVVFSSADPGPRAGSYLAQMLLRALARMDSSWSFAPDESAICLHKSTQGAPCLFLGDRKGPSLSFSHGEGQLWAAMSGRGRVGIDVAYPKEFAGDYPFARAFRPEELKCARALCHDDTARGASLIWSAKEASVKTTGGGFNRFDPLDVRVGEPTFQEQGFVFDVLADRPITAWARAQDTGWLCVALA